jgi:hypothetical protein
VQAEEMKLSRNAVLWLVVAACLMLSFVGFFYAYYYSWLLTTPGVPVEAQQRYELWSRLIGMPSVALFAVAVGGGVWLLFRGRHDKR